MFDTTLNRRLHALALLTVLSVFLATAAFAASMLIKADEGGTIEMAEGVELVIAPKALEEDTVIHARVIMKKDRVCYSFGPDGTVFGKPAKLVVSQQVLSDAGVTDLTLYGEDGEEIKSKISRKKGYVEYRIEHFSIYYHRRR